MVYDQNILLTGGAGSIGRSLIPRVLNHNANVFRVLDNNVPVLAGLKFWR
jgi:FlaA1/EpsC-like NDP-sugar epimerase